jgi:uncharacterized membrane protein
MNWQIIVIVLTQVLFSTSDLMARIYMPKYGFTIAAFKSVWFIIFFAIRIIATFGQLYIFTTMELGKMIALFGAVSIMFANLLGFLVLKEILSPVAYIGVSLAVIAFFVLIFS